MYLLRTLNVMYTAILRYYERHLSMSKQTKPKRNPQSDVNEALALTLYSLVGVILIVAAIYFLTL
jgi:hypothetical protein